MPLTWGSPPHLIGSRKRNREIMPLVSFVWRGVSLPGQSACFWQSRGGRRKADLPAAKMADSSSSGSGFKYRPAPLAPLPQQLDPAYYDSSPEKRRAEAERLAIRARLKRQYLMQFNNPNRPVMIDDPAVTQWVYAKANVYPNFRISTKTSFLGAVFGIGPVFFWWYLFKKERDHREKLIQEGKYERPFQIAY